MENNQALMCIVRNLQIEEDLSAKTNAEQFKMVVSFIDELIQNDFNRLLSILYRVDISEEKLQIKLAENENNAIKSAEIIANLLIERENEKILSRAKYSRK